MTNNSEAIKYFTNNLNLFTVDKKESLKILRERNLVNIEESNNYILNCFKKALIDIKDGKDNSFIFFISINTAIIIHNRNYFHVKVYNEEKNKEEFIIKSLRFNDDFKIHNYKNQGLTLTNHLINRYMQYFKNFSSWKEKGYFIEDFEKELIIKLKNEKILFSKELTDTIYLVVQDTYFVLKKRGKNTISLLTMRPYKKILELPNNLKRKIKTKAIYQIFLNCEICNQNYYDGEVINMKISKDNTFVHKDCFDKKIPNHKNKEQIFKQNGKLYIRMAKLLPESYMKGKTIEELFNNTLDYIENIKTNIQKHICISCNMEINNDDFYERIHNNEKIHKTCAHSIIDIKNTDKVFKYSGINGLKASLKQKEKLLNNKDL